MKISSKKSFVFIILSLTATSAFASYPMICRGGGSMRVNNFAHFYARAGGTDMQPSVDVFFTKASGPSGAQGENLNPGECSWLDRAINDAEPSAINDQYLTGQSIGIASQQSATGSKVIDVTSLYSPLVNANGSKFFVKLFVSGSGGPFMRDPAQPVTTFVRP